MNKPAKIRDMDTLTELDVLKLVCQRLYKADIPYMLTGSLASNFYVVPRMTRDIDFVIELAQPNIDKLFQSFQKDCYVEKNAIYEALKFECSFNIIYNPAAFKIDFMIRKDELYRRLEFQRRQQIYLDKTPIWIVSPEDLIISKLYWAKNSYSEMQLKDVHNLLCSQKNLDYQYLDEWIQKLNLIPIYEKVKA